jgi:hypothetical protein
MADPLTNQIDTIVDRVIVLNDNPDLDDALILRLQFDLAAKIHDYNEIAIRYGLGTDDRLFFYLARHPDIVAGVKKMKAMFESEHGVEGRIRLKAMEATERLVAPIANLALDGKVNAQQRIDALKQLSRIAGVDGLSGGKDAKGLPGGAAFVLNMFFDETPTRFLGTAVINPDEIPGPPQGGGITDPDDDVFDVVEDDV